MFNIRVAILVINLVCVLKNVEYNSSDWKIACAEAFYDGLQCRHRWCIYNQHASAKSGHPGNVSYIIEY